MLLTNRLLKELNIHLFVSRGLNSDELPSVQTAEKDEKQTAAENIRPHTLEIDENPTHDKTPQLSKDEYRLIFKMLQAIGHEFSADLVSWKTHTMVYQLFDKNLIFDDVHVADSEHNIHLAALSDLLKKPELKRPVWEKLKNLSKQQ